MSDPIVLKIPDPDMVEIPLPILDSSLTPEEIGVCILLMGMVRAHQAKDLGLLSVITAKIDTVAHVVEKLHQHGVLRIMQSGNQMKLQMNFESVQNSGEEEEGDESN